MQCRHTRGPEFGDQNVRNYFVPVTYTAMARPNTSWAVAGSARWAGQFCIYDDALRKIAEVSVDDVIALQLEDLTGDGRLEILCWQDHHNGTDGWRRYLRIFRLSKSRGLKPVWEGCTYALSNVGGIDVTRHKIRILRTRGKPAVIETEEIYRRGTHEDTENGTSYSYLRTPYTITRYDWNPVAEKFESSKKK